MNFCMILLFTLFVFTISDINPSFLEIFLFIDSRGTMNDFMFS
jgi:hypothetical protein